MSATAHPLQWPAGWPRTIQAKRSPFGRQADSRTLTLARARDEVFAELRRLGARGIVISTNVELRRDGLPYSNRTEPEDSGVAVYFDLEGRQQCVPCDRWRTVAENLHAIALSIAALRGLERWGAKSFVDAAFRGFKALPESAGGSPWWETLGIQPTAREDAIRAAYKARAMETHPDRGGTPEKFRAVRAALVQGLQAVGVSA